MKAVLVCAFAVAASLLVVSEASALELGTPKTKVPFRSAQNFALEIRVSPYTPEVDNEPGLRGTPYKDNFGDGPRILIGLEFDWQTLRIPGIGTLGPGVGIGTVSMSRNAHTVSGRESGDSYELTIQPIYLAAVLRVDTLWRNLGFPLMPYAKAGLGVAFWDASNAIGTSRAGGVKGSGASPGYNLALGAAFPLDFFDHGASVSMDNTTGINTTSVYFEYYSLALNGLTGGDALRVGTHTWATGLMFEF